MLQSRHEIFALGGHKQWASTVAEELYDQFKARTLRVQAYANLMQFMVFLVLFLTMLTLQRDATAAQHVHSTIVQAVQPGELHSRAEVLEYLESQVALYWRSATCGDGLCEAPFEFASYGRFGCSVDCGFLHETVDTQSIQVWLTSAAHCSAASVAHHPIAGSGS